MDIMAPGQNCLSRLELCITASDCMWEELEKGHSVVTQALLWIIPFFMSNSGRQSSKRSGNITDLDSP